MVNHLYGGAETAPNRLRWWALAVIALGMLMGVFDVTVVNVALPSIGQSLGVADSDRPWIVTAYTLAFAGLLLVGGRVTDQLGRKTAFLIALGGFAAASAAGGLATSLETLLAARVAQGMCGALLAPAALSLVATTFPDTRERGRAFAAFGLVMSGGAGLGLVLGGVLTEYLGWRWVFYINLPLAIVAIAGTLLVVPGAGRGERRRVDLLGAVTGTAGLSAVVYAFGQVPGHGWFATRTLLVLSAGLLLVLMFARIEATVAQPLLPLRILAHRTRSGTYLAFVLVMVGMFLLLSFYLQTVAGYSARQAGVAFLPFAGATFIAATVVGRTMTRFMPGVMMAAGLLLAAAGMGWLSQLRVDSTYATTILPAVIIIGLGVGTLSPVAANLSTYEVPAADTGIASAVFNVSEQIGASLGLALLNTIATVSTHDYLATHPRAPDAALAGMVHGYTVATGVAAGILAAGAITVLVLVDANLTDQPEPGATAPKAALHRHTDHQRGLSSSEAKGHCT